MPDRRSVLAGILLGCTAGAVATMSTPRLLASQRLPFDLAAAIPGELGEWRVNPAAEVTVVAPDVKGRLDLVYPQLLMRTYEHASGYAVMLLIGYGTNQADRATVAHLPEWCYPAQGFAVADRAETGVDTPAGRLPVVRLVARRAARQEPVTYWATLGTEVFTSDLERRLARARYALDGWIPDGMLVRVSSVDADATRAFREHDTLIRALQASTAPSDRALMFGLA